MYREEDIDESLEFCRDIDAYYRNRHKKNAYEEFKNRRYEKEAEAFSPGLPDDPPALRTEPDILVNRISRFLIELFFCMLIALALAYLITAYIGQHTRVDGISMENTLHDQDYLIIDKLTYHFTKPKRFDIIVFPFEEDVYYIKRIIGLPGETVWIAGTDILINGRKLEESYGKEPIAAAGDAVEPVTLAQDEYFVLGDNRNHSMDSRNSQVGLIHRRDIVGRAFLRIYPFRSFGLLKHGSQPARP